MNPNAELIDLLKQAKSAKEHTIREINRLIKSLENESPAREEGPEF